jgi:hypothetical protein
MAPAKTSQESQEAPHGDVHLGHPHCGDEAGGEASHDSYLSIALRSVDTEGAEDTCHGSPRKDGADNDA